MITISNNRIFIDGKETVDPLKIGYWILEFVENSKTTTSKSFTISELLNEDIKEEYFSLVDRKTIERETIFDFILKENHIESISDAFEKFNKEHKLVISRGTFYNTVNSLVEHGILIKVPQRFEVNR